MLQFFFFGRKIVQFNKVEPVSVGSVKSRKIKRSMVKKYCVERKKSWVCGIAAEDDLKKKFDEVSQRQIFFKNKRNHWKGVFRNVISRINAETLL